MVPLILMAYTQAVIYTVAEKAADIIRGGEGMRALKRGQGDDRDHCCVWIEFG